MPTFDVVSQVNMQEVRNAVDQASREVTTRFDFKDTGSSIELSGQELRLGSSTEDRLRALTQVLNAAGQEGWELAATGSWVNPGAVSWCFKRPL